ncbi:hypothetical protein HK096_005833 [Nowakowskiella sp. JEL0078]|nr:hypothetical protein HK096_005833 [Nowakowskiella sp. JEL0078]
MFIWIGKESTIQVRNAARELLARIVPLRKRPKWVGLHKVVEGSESEVFKLRFGDWEPPPPSRSFLEVLSEDGDTSGNPEKKGKKKEAMRVDVRALYQTQFSEAENKQEAIELELRHSNSLLVSISGFVYRRSHGGFVRMSEERGHFFETDAYVFLAVYHLDTNAGKETQEETLSETLQKHRLNATSNSAAKRNSSHSIINEVVSPASSNPSPIPPSLPEEVDEPASPKFFNPPPIPPPLPPLSVLTSTQSQIPSIVTTENLADDESDQESGNETDSESSSVNSSEDVDNPLDSLKVTSSRRSVISITPARSELSRSSSQSSSVLPADDKQELPKVECVVYFWQGQLAPRLAYSTFKFKTQVELENLVKDMYGCPVRVIILEAGRENIRFMSHLSNFLIVHRNTDKSLSTQKENVVGNGGAQAAREIQAAKGLSKSESEKNNGTRMFHIRTDKYYGTTRAVEVVPSVESLISRDCFFIHGPDLKETTEDFLWFGRLVNENDKRLAQISAEKIVERRIKIYQKSISDSVDESEFDADDTTLGSYHIIEENTEPESFWKLLDTESKLLGEGSHGIRNYTTGAETHSNLTPRFFRCSCSSGIFNVMEILNFQQSDLLPDTCVLLDSGPGVGLENPNYSPLFVWIGKESSDVVRKLSRKSVEVWFANLNDGRRVGSSGWWSVNNDQQNDVADLDSEEESEDDEPGNVIWVLQGTETMEFRSFFHGWWWDPKEQDAIRSRKKIF